ncbi:hypothetical protein HZA33_00570 [Candidatus Pacearchaeota archaeon]|nr:hypothetical protein [Candidatus Pacearchaeota archaeon]
MRYKKNRYTEEQITEFSRLYAAVFSFKIALGASETATGMARGYLDRFLCDTRSLLQEYEKKVPDPLKAKLGMTSKEVKVLLEDYFS